VNRFGPDAPAAPGDSAAVPVAAPASATDAIDPSAEGIRSIIWATGYAIDFSWIDLPIFDERKEPIQHRGVTAAPGIYFLGLRRQYKLKSSLLSGVGEDAAHLAEGFAQRR
jgi:putative flavoprotein involved in K+ transport